jgi:hypothetical protein
MPVIALPDADGRLSPFATSAPRDFPECANRPFNRIAYSAAHVVADPLSPADPWLEPALDWDATVAYRARLWDLGLGVAEAMDTAQRGMGLDWNGARELIRRALAAARMRPGVKIACGVGTDHLDANARVSVDDIIRAYEQQIEAIEAMDGRLIVMASRALARAASGPEDYARVYGRILRQVKQPVIIHWLGEMFDPALAGYWGAGDHYAAMETCLAILQEHAAKIDGIKISLLSKEKEISMRRRLPKGVRMYTGDDFNYAELIAGDEEGYSHALLGIFDAIAPAASAGLARLAKGDLQGFHGILEPTVPLSRHIFKNPTRFYKNGVVLLAWLNGQQDHFMMIGGQESARSLVHLAELFRLADKARVLHDPDLAASRMTKLLAVHGLA